MGRVRVPQGVEGKEDYQDQRERRGLSALSLITFKQHLANGEVTAIAVLCLRGSEDT